MTEDPKEFISRFEINSILGRGGMGTVYKAFDPYLKKTVAIKVIDSVSCSDEARVRFQNEAKTLQKLKIASIPEVYNFGLSEDDQPYLVMEFVEGQSLKQQLENEELLSFSATIEIMVQVCDALGYAHSLGVFHRDLKPDNIILQKQSDSQFFVKVIDFGLAKSQLTGSKEQDITKTGKILGSPPYMSPEQIKGKSIDGRSDVYSLGCVLFEILTGEKMFFANTPLLVISKHITEEPPRLSSTIQDVENLKVFESVYLKCVQKDPEKRYQSMDELKMDLLELKVNVAKATFIEYSNQDSSEIAEIEKVGPSIVKIFMVLLLVLAFPLFYLIPRIIGQKSENRKVAFTTSASFSGTSEAELVVDSKGCALGTFLVEDEYLVKEKFPKTRKYIFESCDSITSRGIAHLPTNLVFLKFERCNIDEAMIQLISKRFKSLTSLAFVRSLTFPSKGLGLLKACPKLVYLDVLKTEGKSLTMPEIEEIVQIKGLKHLSLQGHLVDSKAIKKLESLPNLEQLYLHEVHFTNEMAKQLSSLKNLSLLSVIARKYDDDSLAPFGKLKVETLAIDKRLTEKDYKFLSKLKYLKNLQIPRKLINKAELRKYDNLVKAVNNVPLRSSKY